MNTKQLSYESLSTEDLTRLSRCLEALQESARQLLHCKLYPWKEPSLDFVSVAQQNAVVFSQFAADFSAINASMHWLLRDKSITSETTPSAGDSSTQTGENQLTGDIGTPTVPPGSLQPACEWCNGRGLQRNNFYNCLHCRGTGLA